MQRPGALARGGGALTQLAQVRNAHVIDAQNRRAGVDIAPHQRQKLERLCRYVSRPAVATERLGVTSSGQVRYPLKTAYRDGTTHIGLEALDRMARLAALVPPRRRHLTRSHGVCAPHSKLRAAVTPAHRGSGGNSCPHPPAGQAAEKPPATHAAMSWARRPKRVFGIEIDHCGRCAGQLKIIASIEAPEAIAKILAHLDQVGQINHYRGRAWRRAHRPLKCAGCEIPKVRSNVSRLCRGGPRAARALAVGLAPWPWPAERPRLDSRYRCDLIHRVSTP